MAIKWRKYSGTNNSTETEVSDDNPLPVTATIAPTVGASTEAKQDSQIVLATALNALVTTMEANQLTSADLYKILQEIRDGYSQDPTIDKPTNSRRALPQGGTITTVTGVTTVSTVTNLSQIGAVDANYFIKDNSFQAWAMAVRNLLT
jgi:hypothetical protein